MVPLLEIKRTYAILTLDERCKAVFEQMLQSASLKRMPGSGLSDPVFIFLKGLTVINIFSHEMWASMCLACLIIFILYIKHILTFLRLIKCVTNHLGTVSCV